MNPVGAVGTYRSVGFAPRLSVVVPAHNRAPRLPALLAALRAELDRHGAAELILVDSASADETGRVAAAAAASDPARVRALRVDRPGACRARNQGLAVARAPLVVFLDDDVLPRPGCFAALEAAHADRRVHVAGGRIVLRFENLQEFGQNVHRDRGGVVEKDVFLAALLVTHLGAVVERVRVLDLAKLPTNNLLNPFQVVIPCEKV